MIAEKLQQLNQIKEDIKQALIEKGLLAGSDMTEYALLIKNIATCNYLDKISYSEEFYIPVGCYFDSELVADETIEVSLEVKLMELHRQGFIGYRDEVINKLPNSNEVNYTPGFMLGTSVNGGIISFQLNRFNSSGNESGRISLVGPAVCMDIIPELYVWNSYKMSWGKVWFNDELIFDVSTADPITQQAIGEKPFSQFGNLFINNLLTADNNPPAAYKGVSGGYYIKNLKIWKAGKLVGDFRYYNDSALINVVDNSIHYNIGENTKYIIATNPIEVEVHGLVYADTTEMEYANLDEIKDIYYIVHKDSNTGPIEAIYKGEEKLLSAGDTIINVDSSGSLLFMSLEINIDINSDYTIPETNITTNNNELYFIYDNRDRSSWYVFNVTLINTSLTAVVSKGHLNAVGDYVLDEIINDTLKSGTICADFINHDYDYVVIKISGLIKTWTISITNVSLNNIKISGATLKMIEVVADLPSFTGPGVNSNHLKKFTLKNATPTTLASAFNACYCLEEFNFIDCDLSLVTTITSMFASCWSLKSIDLSLLGLSSKLNNIASAFNACRSVESINLENVDTSNCTSFASLFYNCYSLKEIKGLNNLNVSKVTILNEMFYACRSIESIDLSNLTFPLLTSVVGGTSGGTFNGCWSLKTLKLPILNLLNCTLIVNMFSNCLQLIFDYDLVNKIKYFNISSRCTNAASAFYLCYNLTDLDISSWDLGGCTTIASMFSGCWNLKSIKLPSCRMQGAINSFFANCFSLEEADLSTLDFNNTSVSFASLFDGCWSIKSIKCPVNALPTTIANMFLNCKSLLNIEGFENINTSACTSIGGLFSYCYSLKEANLSNLTIGVNCTSIASMFRDCYSLEEIIFNPSLNHNTSKLAASQTYLVTNAYNLKKFECLISINTVTSVGYSFSGCINLKEINTAWNLSKCTTGPNFGELVNLEFIKFIAGPNAAINISSATRLSKLEIINLINCLPTVSAKTLTLGQLKIKLSEDELKLATDKGWTVA